MADAKELKPCPCGKTPDRLGISDGGQGGKYHFVAGDCCSEWMIEFRANYKPLESDECMALAIAAWNASPRAATPPADAALGDVTEMIIRDACESEVASPDHPDSVCIHVDDLTAIVSRHVAAIRARQQAVAVEGFVMVPVEPTFAMRCAFREADEDATDRALGPAFNIAYRALLAASQSATGGA